jgi:flagellar motor switch protein FliG
MNMLTAKLTETTHLSGADKAAILIMYLNEEVVREIFSRLSETEIRRVGEAISRLEHVEPDLLQAIIAEFAGGLSKSLYLQSQGNNYLESVFPAVLGEEKGHRMLRSIEPVSRVGFQRKFEGMQPGALAARLVKEHPQTISVACAVLGPELTAQLLPCFPMELQVDVVLRVSRLKEIPLELLEDIEELLGRVADRQGEVHHALTDGSQVVADTVNQLGNDQREALMAAVARKDEDIASEISKQMFSFDMLCNADSRGIQNLLKEVERKDLAMSLKAADEETRALFFGNMSERAAGYLKDDMEAMGPVRLSEVEAAQQQIIALALRLEEEGKLIFMGSGEAVVE